MTERHCHRCSAPLHVESEGALLFCSHCGAAQISLSEELQERAAEQLRSEQRQAELDDRPPAVLLASSIDWKLTIKLSLAVCGALTAFSIVLPPMAVLVFAWAPVTPAVVMSLYASRGKPLRVTGGIGARVGLVCGSMIVAAMAVLNTILLDFTRFFLHRSDFDTTVDAMVTQVRTQTTAQYGGTDATGFLNLFAVPDFRAGLFLTGFAMMAALIMLLATGGGAIAGTFQRRRRVS